MGNICISADNHTHVVHIQIYSVPKRPFSTILDSPWVVSFRKNQATCPARLFPSISIPNFPSSLFWGKHSAYADRAVRVWTTESLSLSHLRLFTPLFNTHKHCHGGCQYCMSPSSLESRDTKYHPKPAISIQMIHVIYLGVYIFVFAHDGYFK